MKLSFTCQKKKKMEMEGCRVGETSGILERNKMEKVIL